MNTPLFGWRSAGLATLALAANALAAVSFRTVPFDDACAAAAKEERIVLIDFYATWCEPCKRLDTQTWADAGVGRLVGEKAIALKLDAEKEGLALARRFKITAYPTMLLLKPDGTEIDRLVGFMEPAAFTKNFLLALQGKNTLTRAAEAVAAKGDAVDRDAVQARYELARALVRQGDQAGALREFLWCFDVGMVEVPSYTGVRTSFLLGEIGRLAKVFPPAREALLERGSAAEKRMTAEIGDRRAAQEFAAICAELGDEARLLAAFDGMAVDDPRRLAFGLRAFRVLLPRQRYVDALSAMPHASMDRLFQASLSRPTPPGADPQIADAMRRSTVRSTLDYVEVLAGANDLANAEAMSRKLLEYDGSPETRQQLQARLSRAGQPDLIGLPSVALPKN